MTIHNIDLSGENADQFEIVDENCTATPIAPQESCVVNLAFSPTAEGVKNASLEIGSDDPGSLVKTIALVGTGTANAAPRGIADTYDAQEDIDLSVPAPGVLGNDEDDEGDSLSVRLVPTYPMALLFSTPTEDSFIPRRATTAAPIRLPTSHPTGPPIRTKHW